jgi:D-serine deaminase-like pyridoxal phosphate-dependent protein
MCAREILFKFAVKCDKVLGVRAGVYVSMDVTALAIALVSLYPHPLSLQKRTF